MKKSPISVKEFIVLHVSVENNIVMYDEINNMVNVQSQYINLYVDTK